MNYEWLTAQSFERAHVIVTAINTLSIQAKLQISGRRAGEDSTNTAKARTTLLEFLEVLGQAVENAEKDRDRIAFGVDPRLSQLAQQVAHLRRQYPPSSALSRLSFGEARDLLVSPRPEDTPRLLALLKDLRTLVERHSHPDVVSILGDL